MTPSWLPTVAAYLQQHDSTPLFGNAPPFDWERLSALMASRFGLQQFTIAEKGRGLRSAAELKAGLGEELMMLPIHLSPLEGNAYWMMSRESVAKFTAWMLSGKSQAQPLASEILAEGFYRFLALETLDVLSSLEPLQSFSMTLSEEESLEGDAFCIDVALSFEKRTCWGRLAIPEKLQKRWAEHFSKFDVAALKASARELPLSVQVGSLQLTPDEWESAKVGDFVALERGGYDPRHHSGVAYLVLGDEPLMEVKVKHNKLHVLSAPGLREETAGNVRVQLAHLKVPLAKLLELGPEGSLELPIHAEQAAHLILDGQAIGSGELVHLGETLGIRVLQK